MTGSLRCAILLLAFVLAACQEPEQRWCGGAASCLGCAPNETACKIGPSVGQCFDLTKDDHDNCGACNLSCGAGTCVSGACVCPTPQTFCPTPQPERTGVSSCVDLQTDTRNCGTCGQPCDIYKPMCVAGQCR
jgi:hypothetical protein